MRATWIVNRVQTQELSAEKNTTATGTARFPVITQPHKSVMEVSLCLSLELEKHLVLLSCSYL